MDNMKKTKPPMVCRKCGTQRSNDDGACACWTLLPTKAPPDVIFTNLELEVEIGLPDGGDLIRAVLYRYMEDLEVDVHSDGKYRTVDELLRAGFVEIKLFERAWILNVLKGSSVDRSLSQYELYLYFSDETFESAKARTVFCPDGDDSFAYESERSYVYPKVTGPFSPKTLVQKEEQLLVRMSRAELIDSLRDYWYRGA